VNGTERAIRWSTIAAVTGVAIVAGWVSYEHALAVVRAHGETGTVAQVYPVTVDGLIYSASMVLLDAARRGVRAPGLARWLLACGIGATLAANVAAGLHFGPVGAVVAAWPALALVGSYELLMLIIRSSAGQARVSAELPEAPEPAADTVPVTVPEVIAPEVPSTAYDAARAAYVASVRGANPISERGLSDRFGIPRSQARKLRAEVAAASNGHSPADN
jgi:hypothetical protein